VVLVGTVVFTVVLATACLARGQILGALASAWLEHKGIDGTVAVDELSLREVSGSIRLGPQEAPDFVVERFELELELAWPWLSEERSIEVPRVRLLRPALQVGFAGGQVQLGALDPVLAEFAGDAGHSRDLMVEVLVEDGTARVDMGRGSVELRGDGRALVDTRGEAISLLLALETGTVRSPGVRAMGVRGHIGGVVHASEDESGAAARLLTIDGVIAGERLRSAAWQAEDAALTLSFFGVASGGLQNVRIDGRAVLGAKAAHASTPTLAGEALTVDVTLAAVHVTPAEGHTGVIAHGWVAAGLGALVRGDLRLTDVRMDAAANLDRTDATRLALEGASVSSRVAWTPAENRLRSAIGRALADFHLEAPQFDLVLEHGRALLRLGAPVRSTPASGGTLVVSPRRDRPLYAGVPGVGTGAFDVRVRGGGLPNIRAAITRYALGAENGAWRIDARARGAATIDAGPLRKGKFVGAGSLALTPGRLRFSSAHCVSMTAAQFGRGAATMVDLEGVLCPENRTLLTYGPRGWKVAGLVSDVAGEVPKLGLRFEQAQGRVQGLLGTASRSLDLEVRTSAVVDHQKRVRRLEAAGTVRLVADAVTATFDVAANEHRLGRIDLRHDIGTHAGKLELDASGLRFHPRGLQPADVLPVTKGWVGSPTTGVVDVSASVAWGPHGATSSGRIRTDDLDFVTPAGKVAGLRTDIELTSLQPLTTAPRQEVRIGRLQGPIEIRRAHANVSLAKDVLYVQGTRFSALQGRGAVAPLRIPLGGRERWRGSVGFRDMQLDALIESSSVGDRLDFEGKVDGTLRFSYGPSGLRIAGGRFAGTEPGRLSIDPSLLSGSGTPGFEASSEGLSGIALQALQHLAFERLDGTVAPMPDGRLGVQFLVRGRHDPPSRQSIEIRWRDLIHREFADDLSLPSGTRIDFTLDTAWNLDGLPHVIWQEPR
jgi:hypothetical protein